MGSSTSGNISKPSRRLQGCSLSTFIPFVPLLLKGSELEATKLPLPVLVVQQLLFTRMFTRNQ